MKKLSETDRISLTENCILYQTPQTSINPDTLTLQYVCSEQAGKVAFHRKLRVYKSNGSFYVIARGTRCYVDNLANKWFLK